MTESERERMHGETVVGGTGKETPERVREKSTAEEQRQNEVNERARDGRRYRVAVHGAREKR